MSGERKGPGHLSGWLGFRHTIMIKKKKRPSQDPGYKKWHAELKARGPETWLAMIRALPAHLQNGVARIVWWDYFADKSVADKWPQLDWCLNTRDEPNVEEWQAALVGLDYPVAAAERRVNRYQKFFGYTDQSKVVPIRKESF